MEDFQAKAIPHFNDIFRVALKLTKNRSEASVLTEVAAQNPFPQIQSLRSKKCQLRICRKRETSG